jgi:gluconolactonase
MHMSLIVAAAMALGATPALAESRKIDLRTTDGVKAVKGAWKYHDVKVVEVDNKAPDGSPNKTYGIEPRAGVADFDDSSWETVVPETLKDRRSTGKVCFCWYRIKITLPEGVEGKKVEFFTTVDDYGEIWVDGQLPRKVGQAGGNIVAGFNVPNHVELKDPKPGKTYQLAIFGINGPISAEPGNYIFLGPTYLEISDP